MPRFKQDLADARRRLAETEFMAGATVAQVQENLFKIYGARMRVNEIYKIHNKVKAELERRAKEGVKK